MQHFSAQELYLTRKREMRICRLFRSGLDGQVVPVCRKEILSPSSVSKCIFWGRMSCSIKIMSFVFHFLFQCGFPPGFPVSTLHTFLNNKNKQLQKQRNLVLMTMISDQHENPRNPNVFFLGVSPNHIHLQTTVINNKQTKLIKHIFN